MPVQQNNSRLLVTTLETKSRLLGYRIRKISTGVYRTPVHKHWTKGPWSPNVKDAKVYKNTSACMNSLYGEGWGFRSDDGTIINWDRDQHNQYIKETYEFIPVYEA